MAMHRDERDTEGNPPWIGLIKFLFIVSFTLMLFFLGRSMVRHHFFSGDQFNQHDTAEP